jgi:DNA-binding NarL/FixJ family response regulator
LFREVFVVYSGNPALKVYGEAVCNGSLVSLIWDDPPGFALRHLSHIPRPVLILVYSYSPAHIRDLLNLQVEGLVAVTHSLSTQEIQTALARVGKGELFYDGPRLDEKLLTHCERETLRLVALGLDNSEIAQQTQVKLHTVENRISSLKEKLWVKSLVGLAHYYFGLQQENNKGESPV